MIDLTDKIALEGVFAGDFGTPYYPILANLYLQEGDLRRAKKVCEIGLDYDSSNADGKFILAKVALTENKMIVAEKWLKQVIVDNPAHFNALRMLIKLEIQLKRSSNTIKNYVRKLLQYLTYDAECAQWLNEINTPHSESISNEEVSPSTKQGGVELEEAAPVHIPEEVDEKTYEVVESMATFTMVQVLKSQQHFYQALAVLNVLESRGGDRDRIAREKGEVQQLIVNNRK